MSKKFRITVNGESYEVEVEDLGGDTPVARRPVTPAAAAPVAAAPVVSVQYRKEQPVTPVAAAPAAPAPAAKPVAAGKATVTAPMPGTVLDIKVKEGDQVKLGDTVIILEAMKMENEIASTAAGTVTAVNVSKGSAVNPGDVLLVIG